MIPDPTVQIIDRMNKTLEEFDKLKKEEDISGTTYQGKNIEVIKGEVLSELDDLLGAIHIAYQASDLDKLQKIKGHVEVFIEKCNEEEIVKVFQTVFGTQQEVVEAKVDEIIRNLGANIIKLEDRKVGYLDEHRLLKGQPGDSKVKPIFREWYISQAILTEKARTSPPALEKQCSQAILQSYRKAAGFREAEALDVQTTPLFATQSGYYRHDDFAVTCKCCQGYAEKIGVDYNKGKIFLIESPLIREVFNREMPHPTLDLNIERKENFEALVDQLLREATAGKFPDSPILFDLSAFLAKKDIASIDWQQLVLEFEGIVTAKLEKLGLEDPSVDTTLIRDKLIPKLQPIAFIEYQDQTILIAPEFFGGQTFDTREQIADIVGRTGFRISPSHTVEAWLKVADLQKILIEEDIPLATLATKGSTIPIVCKDCIDFTQRPVVKALAELGEKSDAPPYQRVLAKSTASLIEGLASCEIDEKAKSKGVDDLLQISYFRMLNAATEALIRKNNYNEFYTQIELIHQEIQSLMALIEPYGDEELAQTIRAKLTTGPSPIIPVDLDPAEVHLKASAMHAMTSTIASVEAQKGSNQLNVAVLKDSYFETSSLFEKAHTHHVSILNGDKFNDLGMDHAFDNLSKTPIDLFVCEFHHNLSLTRQVYKPENITEQVKAMKNKGLLADKCTIVIDTTINLEQSDDVRHLLNDPEIHEMIQKGQLNVVFLRSAQKFDMLGFDNYYGGITTTVNNHEAFNAFNERMNHQQDQLKGFNYQGLTHLQKFGDLDNYRQAIIDNTHKLYEKLPTELIYDPGKNNTFPMQTSLIQDDMTVFLDNKFPNYPRTGYVTQVFTLRRFARERKLPLTARSSFGFANTNISGIQDGIFRLNPGLDKEEILDQYAYFYEVMYKSIKQFIEELDVKSPSLTQEERDKALAEHVRSLKFP